MESFINIAISTSVTAVIILTLKSILKNRISPKWQFALWIVIALRLLVPVLPQSRVSVLNAVPQVKNIEMSNKAVGGVSTETKTYITGNIAVGEKGKEFNINKTLIDNALIIWLAGSLVMLLYISGAYFIYHRKTRRFKLATEGGIYSILNECRSELGINALIKVRIGGDTPLLKGIFNPEIILPEGYTKQELKSVFMHELMHYKHNDVLWNVLSTLLLCAYWYNPVIWYSFSMFRRDMEILCDYRVLEVYKDRKMYASVLLKTALRRNRFLLCTTALQNGEKDISRRIKYIAYFKRPKFVWSVIGILSAIIVAAVCLTNPLGEAADKVKGLNYGKIYEYKTPYIGDASKVGNLVGSLYYEEYSKGISLRTDSRPYVLNVNYSVKSERISQDNILKNAAVIFCLINNVDNITFLLDDGSGVKSLTYERKFFDEAFGKDIRAYSSSLESFKNEFIPLLEKQNWEKLRKSTSSTEGSIAEEVEKNLEIIMSSPKEASSTGAYINAHQKEYQNILKMGDEALEYMLSQFKNGKAEGLKGNIMQLLCIELLGDRNNVKEGTYLSPQDWYNKLSPYTASKLPPFKHESSDATEQMVYIAAMNKYSSKSEDTLTIVAPHIFGTYETGNEFKIFATVYYSQFKLYDKTLSESSGGIVPAAIVYIKNSDGTYSFKEYTEAQDGSDFKKSIEEFCKPRSDIAKEIMKHYGNYEDLFKIMRENITNYLKENGMKGINLKENSGEIVPLT